MLREKLCDRARTVLYHTVRSAPRCRPSTPSTRITTTPRDKQTFPNRLLTGAATFASPEELQKSRGGTQLVPTHPPHPFLSVIPYNSLFYKQKRA